MIPGKSEKSVKVGNDLIGILLAKATPKIRGAILGRDYSGNTPPKGFAPLGFAPKGNQRDSLRDPGLGVLPKGTKGNTSLGRRLRRGGSAPPWPPYTPNRGF